MKVEGPEERKGVKGLTVGVQRRMVQTEQNRQREKLLGRLVRILALDEQSQV